MEKQCLICKTIITKGKRYSYKQWDGRKFCSNHCAAIFKASQHIGKDPWNKGTKGVMKPNKTSWVKADDRVSGANHRQWLGDNPTYSAVHYWVASKLGKPQRCDNCKTTIKRQYHWSNKDGKYSRDLSTWWRLCVPCHSRFDRGQL